MNARLIFHTATIAKYQKMYIVTIHSYPFAELVGRNTTRKVRLTLKNNSYVYIAVDKIVELITEMCPPVSDPTCPGKCEYGTGGNCAKCWQSWFEDGASNA